MLHDFISIADCTTEEVYWLLDEATRLKRRLKEGHIDHPLAGQTVAMIFEKPSLRTRVTFETGVFQLGAHAIVLESGQIRLGERESVPDVARNLDRWVNCIVARTFSHEAVADLAAYSQVPVINALTDKLHPCQIIADAMTLREHKGDLNGRKVVFVGDGNNVAASWMNFAARVPIDFTLVCPPGYEADPAILAYAQDHARGEVVQTYDVDAGVDGADAVYTDVWSSMGQEDEDAIRRKSFAPYQVNAELMAKAKEDAIFMHCLPAKRGLEVTDDVIDSPLSVVFDEAENRLHAQKAILMALLARDKEGYFPKLRARLAAKAH